MKTLVLLIIIIMFVSCNRNTSESSSPSIQGTWKLVSGTLIENGEEIVTDYTKNVSFIKIINADHFAFLQHDLKKGVDSAAVFVAGGGRYSLDSDKYTEHLEYCSSREWEGNDFSFTIKIKGDTLIQTGIEKIENLRVNRMNIEKYVRTN